MSLSIKVLQASYGDCIVVTVGANEPDPYRILIDGGPANCYSSKSGHRKTIGSLHEFLSKLSAQNSILDLVVLTHVDSDHIGGLLKAYNDRVVRSVIGNNVWFNSGRLIAKTFGNVAVPIGSDLILNPEEKNRFTSIHQGVVFDCLLDDSGVKPRQIKMAGDKLTIRHGEIHVLSPTKEQLQTLLTKWEKEKPSSLTSTPTDYKYSLNELILNDVFEEDTSVHNGSSIAFLISSGDSKALFLGDAFPSTICENLRELGYSEDNPLRVGACKISHHGSKGNTNVELLSLIKSDLFIVSTDGSRYGLPNKVTLARIIKNSPDSKIFFNYPRLKNQVFSTEELNDLVDKLIDIEEGITL